MVYSGPPNLPVERPTYNHLFSVGPMRISNHFQRILCAVLVLFSLSLIASNSWALPKVLVVGAEIDSWGQDVAAKLYNTGQFESVDWFNCRSEAPSLSTLQSYNAVLAFTDYNAATGTGDALASYVDGGGGLVLCMFSYSSGWTFDGPLMTSTYLALSADVSVNYGFASLGGVSRPSHPIMANVTTFDGGESSYRCSSSLVGDAYTIAYWDDENILAAARDDVGPSHVRRADLNFFPVSSDIRSDLWTASTDGAILMANALTWVTGQSAPPPQLSLQPKSLNFGTAEISEPPVTLCVTASNVGEGTLHIQNYSITGMPDYAVTSGPQIGDSILPGSSAEFCISFTPFGAGPRTATFTLGTDGRDSASQSVSLLGTGVAPEVQYQETSLFHTSRVRLRRTTVAYLHVSSIGTGPLTIRNAHFTGTNPDNYTIVHMPEGPIPAGMTDSIGIQFGPKFEGRTDAALVVTTNALTLPVYTLPLSGIGILQRLTITTASALTGNTLNFDSVAIGDSLCAALSLYNPGSDTLTISKQMKNGGDYDFTLFPLTGSTVKLLPGATGIVNICFKPLRNGTRVANFSFYTDIPQTFDAPPRDTSKFTIYVTGIGVPFGKLIVTGPIVDSALVRQTSCITDLLSNIGQANITVSRTYITGQTAPQFTVNSGAPFTLSPGQSRSASLCFTPLVPGFVFDTLVVLGSTSDHPITLMVPLIGYGTQHCAQPSAMSVEFGTKGLTLVGSTSYDTITVNNCGDFPETYSAQLLSGVTTYTVTPAASAVIAPGSAATFIVKFAPLAIGPAVGSLQITSGATPQVVTLNGVGAGIIATAMGAPTSPVPIRDCSNFDITITNNGNTDWTLGDALITGADANDFSVVTQATPATIPADGSATITIRFCPKKIGTEYMTLTFPNSSPMPLVPGFSYTTSGIGAANSVSSFEQQDGFELGQTYPNPTNSSADLVVTTPRDANVRIDILDLTGHVVRTVFSGFMAAGKQVLTIDGKDLSSGTYLYTLTSGNVRLARQFMLMK